MPLLDLECANGHLTEVLKRGAVTGPFACPECGETAERKYSTFAFSIQPDTEAVKPKSTTKRGPKYVTNRSGGGAAARTDKGNYRPALTHTAKCPECNRRRNVAVLYEYPYGKRVNCEACGYIWIHQEATAPDPMTAGYDATLAPGKKFSAHVAPGDQYVAPERAV